MSRAKKTLFTCYVIGICSISFLFFSSNCLAATRDPIAIHIQETDTFLAKKLKAKKLIRKASPHQLKGRTVETGKNATATLGDIARVVFSKQNSFRNKIQNLSIGGKGALLQQPIMRDSTYEFKDSFVLVQSTSIIVQDPAKLSRTSPQFRSFLGDKKPGRIVLSQLTRESTAGLNIFIAKVLPKLSRNHPLKKVANGKTGDQQKMAILTAIAEGKGLFETVDEVVIPKKMPRVVNGKVMQPRFINGMFDYGQRIASPRFKVQNTIAIENAVHRIQSQQETPRHSTRMTQVRKGRMIKPFDEKFLTGFTFANNWEWCRTWRFESGLFRIKMGAGYSIGVRIPIQVNGHMKPTRIYTTGRRDVPTTWETHINVRPFEATHDEFKLTGFNENEPDEAEGKELALTFGFGYGYKFRCFYSTIRHRKYALAIGEDWGKDFTPPYNTSGSVDVWIPPSWTHTELTKGIIKGWLKFGFRLTAKGKVSFDYDNFHGNKHNRQNLTFYNPDTVIRTNTIAPITVEPGQPYIQERYGFKLYNPVYKFAPKITPGLQAMVRIGYKGFSRKFGPYTWWASAFEMQLPYTSLTIHDHTTESVGLDIGTKKFTTR